jgi:hypothetical protein
MKTILEWYEELPDGIRERAIRNYDPNRGYNEIQDSLHKAITHGFMWHKTPEETRENEDYICDFFWNEIYREAMNGNLVKYQERAKLSKHKAVRTPMFLGLEI